MDLVKFIRCKPKKLTTISLQLNLSKSAWHFKIQIAILNAMNFQSFIFKIVKQELLIKKEHVNLPTYSHRKHLLGNLCQATHTLRHNRKADCARFFVNKTQNSSQNHYIDCVLVLSIQLKMIFVVLVSVHIYTRQAEKYA